MASFFRSTALFTRVSRQSTTPIRTSYQPVRFASSTYGNSQSGHQKSDAPNPQVDKEHPGPEAPADQGKEKSSSSSSSSSSEGSPESTTEGARSTPSSSSSEQSASNKSKDKSTSSGARPALYDPNDAADTDDPEVKKHNEDMRSRADQTPNQVK